MVVFRIGDFIRKYFENISVDIGILKEIRRLVWRFSTAFMDLRIFFIFLLIELRGNLIKFWGSKLE